MKRERHPTPEEFAKLLAWFHSDPDEAARTFTLTQSRLIRVFAARGCIDSESLADEVVNRVAVRIDMVKTNFSDPFRCCLAFVENVHREYRREEMQQQTAITPPPPRPSHELQREDDCLSDCLAGLTQAERSLFEHYFQGEKRVRINGRKKLAEELLLTANALRLRAHHLRKHMLECMVTCLGES